MITSNEQITQIKTIINEIVQEERVKTGINYKLEPLTIIEYYKSQTFQKELKLMKISKIISSNGFFNIKEKNICVFLKNRNILSFPINLASIVKTTYHELKHAQQFKESELDDFMSYQNFIMLYEELIYKASLGVDYTLRHDEYFSEIDSNLYGVNNTIEYLEKNNLLTEENKKYLELKKKEYELDYENFDIQLVLKKFHNICQSINIKHEEHWFLNIFYTEDMKSFKSIGEILSNPNINRIDKRILTDILSSEHFLNSVDFTNISEEEKNIIMNAINETLNTYISKRNNSINQFQQGFIDSKKWLTLDSSFCNKMTYCNSFISLISKTMTYELTHIGMQQYYSNLSTMVGSEEVNDKIR